MRAKYGFSFKTLERNHFKCEHFCLFKKYWLVREMKYYFQD